MSRERGALLLRWALTAALVAILAVAMVRLSQWQWAKHVARDAQIHRIQANRTQGVVPVTEVVGPAGTVGERERWRSVRITGVYDPTHQLVVRLRSVAGQTGFEILTPVRAADGSAILVDRGLLPLGNSTQRPATIPAAPTGTVTVTGYLRSPEPRGAAPVDGTVRAIDVAAIAPAIPYPLIDGYLQLTDSVPAAAGFVLLPPPSDNPGPYLSYSVQWVIFAAIAVGGLIFLAVDELRGGRVRQRLRPEPAPGPSAIPAPGPTVTQAAEPGAVGGTAAPRHPAERRPMPTGRRPADRGPADRGPADRGPADRGPADRGPADRGPADRGPADRRGHGVGVLAGGGREADLPSAFYDDPDDSDLPGEPAPQDATR